MQYITLFLGILLIVSFSDVCAVEPSHLPSKYLINPPGLDAEKPRLSGIIENGVQKADFKDQKQAAHQVVVAAADASKLEEGFRSPPHSARPLTWWHWVSGNVSSKGITADLQAMKEIGLGGFQIFTVDQSSVLGPVKFMSPEWRGFVKQTLSEADKLREVQTDLDPPRREEAGEVKARFRGLGEERDGRESRREWACLEKMDTESGGFDV